MVWRKNKKIITTELHPDEILLDVHNLPSFNRQQFEGQVEKPISKRSLKILFIATIIFCSIFILRLGYIQLIKGHFYAQKSEQNSFDSIPIFAVRGVIYDRYGTELVWNTNEEKEEITKRAYTKAHGFANLLGYVSYPAKDDKGRFWQQNTIGKDGIEYEFNSVLSGVNGKKLVETDVSGNLISEGTIISPEAGSNLSLSIDSRIQETLYKGIKDLAERSGYVGGTGLVMDINTGELYAITTYPEYNSQIISDGSDDATISHYLQSSSKPLLNRAIDGVYTPGSIVKPFFALAALQEKVISPNKVIYTTGKLEIPNPYNPKLKTVFNDNGNHGPVDMRDAIAVSSNVYFYEIGGGFGSQPGLGIVNLEKYAKMFGLGQKSGINLSGEREGNIPSVAWKAKKFPGDPWRIGDTYNTSIGQYGFQVTPIQMVRAIGAIASRGVLQTPTILKTTNPKEGTKVPVEDENYTVVQEGMRKSVIEGTTTALNNPTILVAAKSGTAQIKNNTRVNSWVEGFFPFENPRFAFVVLMEDGPKVSSGAVHAFRPVLDLFITNPEILTQK